jgi:hypothetical protein
MERDTKEKHNKQRRKKKEKDKKHENGPIHPPLTLSHYPTFAEKRKITMKVDRPV